MKDLLTCIHNVSESEKIETVNFDEFIPEIDKAFKSSGYSISTKHGEHTPDEVYKNTISDNIISYTIVFGKKEGNGKLDFGAYLGMELTVSTDKNDNVEVYSKLYWSNGKQSYSVYSKAHSARRCEINFGEISSKTLMPNWAGGHEYYKCTPEIATAIINGIEEIHWDKHEFKNAMTKSRFTDVQWNKLVSMYKNWFKATKTYSTKYHHFPWE